MHEKTLLKIALVCISLGLVVLFVLTDSMALDETKISHLDQNIDKNVLIKGTVSKLTRSNSTSFIKIKKQETAEILLFNDMADILDIDDGDIIEVRGKVSDYGGEASIVGDEIRKIG